MIVSKKQETLSAMATSETVNVGSHHTALCLVPPRHLWPPIDRLRALYDKAYEKWPPHINLIYPFVSQDSLPRAAELIQTVLQLRAEAAEPPLRVSLDAVDVFNHKHDNTIFLHDSDRERISRLSILRSDILKSLGQREHVSRMHMTVAQSEDVSSSTHKFLQHKAGLLPKVEWEVEELHILEREQLQVGGKATSQMRSWGTLSLSTGLLTRYDTPKTFYTGSGLGRQTLTSNEDGDIPEKDSLQTRSSYYFDDEMSLWLPYQESASEGENRPETLVISSYNVLAEFHWPPSQARYSLIVRNILSRQAVADILVLQEVTDDFLSYMLKDEHIRDLYPFSSHGPPEQPDVEPLPSLLNIVILSKWGFGWEWVPFGRKHKGAVVARFEDIGKSDNRGFLKTVVAAVHLNCGLTDGAVTAKKVDIHNILGYLSRNYDGHPWVLAGDFNISTSSLSISAAVKKGCLSAQSASYLGAFDRMYEEAKLADAWKTSRFELGEASDTEQDGVEELVEGEKGATYDPLVNEVAASIVGSGFNMRPQRYDRILVRGEGAFSISKFNKFGFLKGRIGGDANVEATFASDHWGVRCVLRTGVQEPEMASDEIAKLVVPVRPCMVPHSLSDPTSVRECLAELGVLPSDAETQKRQSVLELLKKVLLETDTQSTSYHKSRSPVIVAPVGSYGLGVWTSSSDMDVLCIGPFSSSTFFSLATQRLRKAEDEGVRILRRVKANSGTMLELDIQGIKMDLQYCPAITMAENWPHVLRAPPTDSVWTLPMQTLSKLKAIRDLDYLRRSIPDMAKFRVAYRFIKTWAKSRGIFSARFGYLGGIQISILLARVYKLLARDNPSTSVPELLVAFFRHYATFDWKTKLVFDPFFHKQRLNYIRISREPLAILGYFPPALNTSQAASLPSVRTISQEFERAVRLLDTEGMDWTTFLCGDGAQPTSKATDNLSLSAAGADDFLGMYKSYVKIDLQYWGLSFSKGAQFVGWLESRFVNVLVDIDRRLSGVLHARMWPARFVEGASASAVQDEEEDGAGPRDYQGCYLVGLGKLDDVRLGKDEMRDTLGALQTVLGRFEGQIRGDGKYFDGKSCWMSASVVSGGEIAKLGLVVDTREWGEYAPGDEEDDEEEEDGEEQELADFEALEAQGSKRRKGKSALETVIAPKLEPGKKFRTAADVMNRLRWDPGMDSGNFIVGYEDRFVGAREKALDTWKSEQTDEEFIPQHRILYFKRKSDGAVVWERRTRKDEVFGSGV